MKVVSPGLVNFKRTEDCTFDLHVGRGFQLGDGRTYGTFQNYELDPGVSYNVGLRSTVEGDDTPMFAVGTQSFGESTEMGYALH